MAHSNNPDDDKLLLDSPAYWDEDTLHQKWKEFLQYCAGQSEIAMPVKRFQVQMERSTEYPGNNPRLAKNEWFAAPQFLEKPSGGR